MIFLGLFLGAILGFFICCLFTINSLNNSWGRGVDAGQRLATLQGKIIARNDDLDEIMVEYGEDMARYKRVIDEPRS